MVTRVHANPNRLLMDGKQAEIFLGQEQSYMVLVDSGQLLQSKGSGKTGEP